MAIIDLSNYDTTLFQATSNAGLDGNVFYDTTAGTIQFFNATTHATLDLTGHGGGATDPNPLIELDGLKFEAIYAFENQERRTDETLRQYDRWTSGTFKFGGAYNFINGRVPLATADRAIIRGSGWNEYGTDGLVDKIYFGNKGLSNIEATSQPYYQLEATEFTTAIDYQKAGQFDEAVLVFEDGVSDNTLNPEVVSIRTYEYNYDRKATNTDLGITELGGYSTGFAVNESPHLTTNETDMPFADVWTTPAGVWLNMSIEELDTPQSEDGFTQGDGKLYTWVLNNDNAATLDEVVAYLDAASLATTDINAHATNTAIGKDVNVWYSYNGAGQIVTQSGLNDSNGFFIEGLVGNDKQRIVQTDDSLVGNTYPFYVSIVTQVGQGAVDDTIAGGGGAWFQTYFFSDYNTSSAITIQDSTTTDVKTPLGTDIAGSSFRTGTTIIYEFDYDGDTLGGPAGTSKNAVMVVEGDGVVTQAKTLYTINNLSSTINITCNPSTENNA